VRSGGSLLAFRRSILPLFSGSNSELSVLMFFLFGSPLDPEEGGSTYSHASAGFYRTARCHTRITAVRTTNSVKRIFMLSETGNEPDSSSQMCSEGAKFAQQVATTVESDTHAWH
jgi:hypothetical protein